MIKTIVNCETGELVEREYTSDEYTQHAIDSENAVAKVADAKAKAATKAALLDRLGITEDEAKLLLS